MDVTRGKAQFASIISEVLRERRVDRKPVARTRRAWYVQGERSVVQGMKERGIGAVSACVVAACIVGAGCVAVPSPEAQRRAQEEALRQRMVQEQVRTEILQSRERVAALETVKEDQARQLDQLRADLLDTRRAVREMGELLGRMQQAVRNMEVSQGRLRNEVVDEISRKMEEILKEQAAKPPPPPPVKPVTGYEHVVRKGDTLLKVADAYRVPLSAILQANEMREGDPLPIGKKLFIPAQ
jgi:LysM repeat protein